MSDEMCFDHTHIFSALVGGDQDWTILQVNKRGCHKPSDWSLERHKIGVMRALLNTNVILLLLNSYFPSAASSPLYSSSCQLQGRFNLNGMHKAGDVILGGLFQIHFGLTYPDLSFNSEPQQPACYGWVFPQRKTRNGFSETSVKEYIFVSFHCIAFFIVICFIDLLWSLLLFNCRHCS